MVNRLLIHLSWHGLLHLQQFVSIRRIGLGHIPTPHISNSLQAGNPIVNSYDKDVLCPWLWWVQPFYKIDNVGSAQTEAEAKQMAVEQLTVAISSH